MTMTKRFAVLAMAALTTTTAALGQSPMRQSSASPGDQAFAARLSELSRDSLRMGPLSEPALRASSQLLQAAHRLDPMEPRYVRLWAQAELQRRDRDGAVAALRELVNMTPTSVTAQTRLMDAHLTRMESADEKLASLRNIVGRPPVGDAVRSHAAGRAAAILLDRGDTDQAKGMLGQALRLNPLNIE